MSVVAAAADPYDLVVRPEAEPDRWTWAVASAHRVEASGQAPNPLAARRCGELTAAAICAFERIGRRRF